MPEIKATEQPLMDIFNDKYIFNIPPYQRPYAWTTEETGELLDDLLYAIRGVEKIDEASPYFLGSIVIIKTGKTPSTEVIDGQQRLTTLTILLCVLRELSDGKMRDELDEFVWQEGNNIKGTENVFRVTLRERDRDFFRGKVQIPGRLQDFLKEDIIKQKDSRQRIFENAKHLWQELSNHDSEWLNRLAMFVIQRCYLVVVSTSDLNSAYRIFAVMNDRGLDLSPTDILKAEIIGDMDEGIRSQYTKKWEDIEEDLNRDNFRDLFAHIRMIYMKNKMRGTLQQEFQDNVLKSEKRVSFIDDVLEPYADAYKIVTKASYESVADAENVNKLLRYLNQLDNFDWIPPAMAFFRRTPNDTGALIKFVRDLERLAYGMFIRRADIYQRIQRYADILRAIEQGKDLFDASSPLQLSPEEKSEILSALNGQIYSLLRVRRPLLLRLDSLMADVGVRFDHPTITIEHVLPQNPNQGSEWLSKFPDDDERSEWTGKLANLVLLSRRKNSQAQNFDFDRKKKEYFLKGDVVTFALTSQVLSETEWTPEVLKRRQKKLIDALKDEWRLA